MASEWLALSLMSCVLGLGGAAPWLTDVVDFSDNKHWQGNCYHVLSMVV